MKHRFYFLVIASAFCSLLSAAEKTNREIQLLTKIMLATENPDSAFAQTRVIRLEPDKNGFTLVGTVVELTNTDTEFIADGNYRYFPEAYCHIVEGAPCLFNDAIITNTNGNKELMKKARTALIKHSAKIMILRNCNCQDMNCSPMTKKETRTQTPSQISTAPKAPSTKVTTSSDIKSGWVVVRITAATKNKWDLEALQGTD